MSESAQSNLICVIKGIWNIIKGWLDPVVASKVHFTKTLAELEHFIDRSHIIKELGGDDPYTYTYIEPSPGENSLLEDTETRNRLLDERAVLVKEYEKITQEWIKETARVGVGAGTEGQQQEQKDKKENDTQLQTKRTEFAQQLRTGYWQLDPYLRAKTLYDRLGVIGEGGKIQFYDSDGSTTTTTGGGAAAAVAVAGEELGLGVKQPGPSHDDKDAAKKAGATAVNDGNHSTPTPTGSNTQSQASAAGANAGVGHRDHDLD